MVKTKIICTIGPSSSSETVLRKMMLAGMDVARLNFSHGTHAAQQERITLIRKLNQKYRRRIRFLGDLEGYRIRVGSLPGSALELKKRQQVLLTNREEKAGSGVIPFDYEGPLSDIRTGSTIYIDDGNIALQVKSRQGAYLKAQVVVPGVLKERKGINIPGARLHFSGLTLKDRQDIDFAAGAQLDYLAQSFVRTKEDILEVKKYLSGRLLGCRIIAKIENREGIRNIDSILDVADGIMIARGDMGVCLPVYEIPMVQKQIIKKCNRRKKMVITATQMLESMTDNPRPTRAEVTDVANAILDGSDFLMLSAETAAGKFPVEAVWMMNQIIKFTESSIAGSLREK